MEMTPNNPPQADASGPVSKPMAGKSMKVSMDNLPPGTKVGDYIELCVKSIDPTTNLAMLTSESSVGDEDKSDQEGPSDEDKAMGNDESDPGLDTKTLLGPMNGLKSYLVQKSMDVPKNQGRS